jgi:hypothetical protein
MLLTFCLAAFPLSGTGKVSCVCRARFACLPWESWLVGVGGSERQVIAVVCGSGIGDVLIELWFLFVWLDTLCEWRCERGGSVCGEGGGPSTNVTRECCFWGISMRDMLPCAVRFLGRALDSVHWG